MDSGIEGKDQGQAPSDGLSLVEIASSVVVGAMFGRGMLWVLNEIPPMLPEEYELPLLLVMSSVGGMLAGALVTRRSWRSRWIRWAILGVLGFVVVLIVMFVDAIHGF